MQILIFSYELWWFSSWWSDSAIGVLGNFFIVDIFVQSLFLSTQYCAIYGNIEVQFGII